MRVPLIVFALVAMPFAAGLSQGQSGGRANPNADNRCKDPAAATRQDAQHRAVAQADQKNCPVVTPPASGPESGPHKALGTVFEDIDGNGSQDMFGGEMGLLGWTVQLYWKATGALVTTASTDDAGNFVFSSLGNGTYFVCIVSQSGYTQTYPTQGSGCNGLGHEFTLQGTIESWATKNDFGEMATP
ncbi:MAG: SdrD B-like domain-containing protein [Gemmatimonadales bacterium]